MKRVLASLLALALVIAPLRAQDIYNPPVAGQLPGTATNDSASAGNVGQILTNSATGVALTTLTAATVTSQALTAGDWNVQCVIKFIPSSATIFQIRNELSPTTNTQPGTLGNYTWFSYQTATDAGSQPLVISTPIVPLSLSATTTYYCTALAQFDAGTMTADAKLVARRAR